MLKISNDVVSFRKEKKTHTTNNFEKKKPRQ